MKKGVKKGGVQKTGIIILVVSILFLAVLGVLFMSELRTNNPANSLEIFNLSSSSVTLVSENDSLLYANDVALEVCEFNDEWLVLDQEPCIKDLVITDSFSYYEIVNLNPEEEINLISYKDPLYRALRQQSGDIKFTTEQFNENPDFPESMFGKVLYADGSAASDVLVKVRGVNRDEVNDIAAITDENGKYSIVFDNSDEGYLQKIEMITPDGNEDHTLVASYDNAPVFDIVLAANTPESSEIFREGFNALYSEKERKLFNAMGRFTDPQKVYADGNTCFEGGALGGISVQCAENVHWFRGLNPNECPDSSKNRMRVGLVRHTHYTHLFEPENGTVKMYLQKLDSNGRADGSPSESVDNGAYINSAVLQDNVSYELKAKIVDGSGSTIAQCNDIDRGGPIIIRKEESDIVHSTKEIENLKKTVEVCPKTGENFAVIPGYVRTDDMIKGVNRLGMSWGEVLIVDLDNGIPQYQDIVERASVVNMNVILRLCYKGNCQIDDGAEYGRRVVDMYNKLVSSKKAPNGIYVHIGHNEPNASEWREPAAEAAFMNAAIEAINSSGSISLNEDGGGIRMLGPNLDLFYKGGDSRAKTATEYMDSLLANGLSLENAKKVYAWTGNTYIKDSHTNISGDYEGYIIYLSGKGLSTKVIATETGKINTGVAWDEYGNQLKKLVDNSNIKAVLMFNSFGLNPDPDFTYHADLHNDYKNDSLNLHTQLLDKTGCNRVAVEIVEPGDPIDVYAEAGTGGPVGGLQADPPTDGPIALFPADGNVQGVRTSTNVLGANSIKLPEVGEYHVTSSKYEVLSPYVSRFGDANGEVMAFLDRNKNGIMDEGEEYVSDMNDLKFEKVGYVNRIGLSKGHNIVSLSLSPLENISAEILINMINNQGGNAVAVGYLENGVWKMFNRADGVSYSRNFDIRPGSAVYVRSLKESEFTLRGQKYTQPVTVYIYRGWNLLGIQGSTQSYTLQDVISSVKSNPRIDAKAIATWDAKTHKYEILVIDGDEKFGDTSRKVAENDGVFILAKEAGEYWKPK